jgi:Ca2+-binding EF-hand superfamily protein
MLVAAQKSPVKRKVKMEYNKKEGGIYKLSTEDKTEIKEVFDLFLKQDSDYPDSISVFDMKIGLRGLGFNLMDGEAFAIMKDYDRDKTGFIQFGDFLEICAKKAATKNHVEDIDHAFKIFDFDNTGKQIFVCFIFFLEFCGLFLFF